MEYTKGKWIADNGDSEYWGVFTDMDDDGICYMSEPNGRVLRSFEESEANARLIAAAPDMYEALKIGLGLASSKLYQHPDEEVAQVQFDEIRKALAEAEGK